MDDAKPEYPKSSHLWPVDMNRKLKKQLVTAALILIGIFVVFAVVSRIA